MNEIRLSPLKMLLVLFGVHATGARGSHRKSIWRFRPDSAVEFFMVKFGHTYSSTLETGAYPRMYATAMRVFDVKK